MIVRRSLSLMAFAVLLVSGCGSSSGSAGPSDGGLTGEIRVAAAASLTEAFGTIGKDFAAEHPAVKVVFDFGPSSGLSDRLVEGAPADVFASADTKNMDKLVKAKVVDTDAPRVFARNQPEIAVPAGNPGKVTGLDDLAQPDLLVGLCAEEVPCGKFARAVLDKAGVVPSVDTNEVDVKALLTKIESGDLDVGLVYRTDVIAAGDTVEGIPIPEAENVVATYPAAKLSRAANPTAAAVFVEYLSGKKAQQVLSGAGFLSP